MLTAIDQSEYAWRQLRLRRPEINKVEDLDNELRTEYYNAMLFASDKVLKNFEVFLADKSIANYQAVAHAMREDLYHGLGKVVIRCRDLRLCVDDTPR